MRLPGPFRVTFAGSKGRCEETSTAGCFLDCRMIFARKVCNFSESCFPADAPISPRRVPEVGRGERGRHVVDPVRAAGTAAQHAKQAHPAAGPEPMPGDRLVGIFRTGRQMPAGIADKTRKRELVNPDECGAEEAAGRLVPRAGPVAAPRRRAWGLKRHV